MSTTFAAGSQEREVSRPSPSWAALVVLLAGIFITALDFFIVNVALPVTQVDLHASSSQIQFIVAGYGLALAAGLITAGRLGDLYGRRRLFGGGMALFIVASLACGIAPSAGFLVGARVVQGLAAALLMQLSTPALMKFYGDLLADGRIKRDSNTMMYQYWSQQVTRGHDPTPRDLVAACGVSIHAARTAVRRYKAGRIPTPQPKGLQPKTVRNIHIMIHRALSDAAAWKYIIDNPAAAAKPPRASRKKRPVWTPAQAQKFMARIRRDRFDALFRLELTTGQRRGEICGVRWTALDLDEGQQSVHESRVVVDGRAQDGQVKTDDSARLNSLDLETIRALREWKTVQDSEREFFGTDYLGTDLVFTWEDGRPVHPDSIRERFKRLAAEAGLPEIRFYDLRHSYVTGALAAGIDPKVVSERVGHADVAFTLETYSHVLPGMDREAAVLGATYLLGDTDPNPDQES